jgi:septal ring-binding cell division protein DamX
VVEKDKITTLRSNTGDSGLMQVNERVWRGLYDTQKLRWDTAYNARAGSEVLLNYLVKYALKRGEQKHPGGPDNLARSAYSTYNGGPSKTSRYRNPKAPAAHKKIDAAFWKKYQAVKQGKELQVAECLGAETPSTIIPQVKKQPPKKAPSPPIKQQTLVSKQRVGKSWVLAQKKNHYTLQLAVFNSYKAAQKFAANTPTTGTLAIAPLGKDKLGQFVVLNGSFEKKTEAGRLKKQYKRLKPWIRQFKDVQPAIKR